MNLGATAIGTGIKVDPRYASLAVEELACLSGRPMVLAPNLIEATSDMGAFVLFSGVLKRVAVKISKICNDLRLLSSGPRTGFAEIRLPPVQAGSSIMPGKVNRVIPEVVNQVAYLVIGHDLTVTLCAEGGQLQLNAFEPTIGYCLLNSIRMLTAALGTLTTRCLDGIEADRERCHSLVLAGTADAPSDTMRLVMMVGRFSSTRHRGPFYAKAQNLSRGLRAAYDATLATHDLLLMPTSLIKAKPVPPPGSSREAGLIATVGTLGNTAPFDVTGYPAMPVPCGTKDGPPIGVMLVGRHGTKATFYRAAAAFEAEHPLIES